MERIKKTFGIINKVELDLEGNLILFSECGKLVSMKNSKWSQDIPVIQQKCLNHIGKDVDIITSQTTAKWSPLEYFCDIELTQ